MRVHLIENERTNETSRIKAGRKNDGWTSHAMLHRIRYSKVRRISMSCLCLNDYIQTTKQTIKREHFDIIGSTLSLCFAFFSFSMCVSISVVSSVICCHCVMWIAMRASINLHHPNNSNCNRDFNREQYPFLLESIKFAFKINPVKCVGIMRWEKSSLTLLICACFKRKSHRIKLWSRCK